MCVDEHVVSAAALEHTKWEIMKILMVYLHVNKLYLRHWESET